MATVTLSLARGLFHTGLSNHISGTPIKLAWTPNVIPTTGATPGKDPITLLLQLLISTGRATNYSGSGTNYDVFTEGAGLGIPYPKIDVAGFEAVRDQFDFDTNMVLHLMSENGEFPKKWLEKELCRPFGMYLAEGNDGVIKLKRPKNPEKFHISSANNTLTFKLPTASTEYDATLNVGVYNRTEMGTEVARALNATATANWECDYGGGTANTIRIRNTADSWDLIYDSGSDQAWQTLGFNAGVTNTAANTWKEANNTTAVFSGTTLTEDDMWDVRPFSSRDDQITSVMYLYDGMPNKKEDKFKNHQDFDGYRKQRWYISSEDVNLGDPLMDHIYVIKSKGLQSGSATQTSTWSHWEEPSSGCTPSRQDPSTTGVVESDGMAMLIAAMLLDRYRQPPMRFSAKIKWKHNALEVGDNIQVTYAPAGVFIDRELNADTLTTRTFELVRVDPVFQRGYVEIHAVGHRAPTTTSVSVTAQGNT